MKKRIWSNGYEAIKSIADDTKEENPDLAGDVIWAMADELNEEYFMEDMESLRKEIGDMIIIADLDLWDGHRTAIKEVSGSIADLPSICVGEIMDWYVEDGEMWIDDKHHDGTNRYRIRAWKDGVSRLAKDCFHYILEKGALTEDDIENLTRPLGSVVAKAYGWKED